MRNCRYLDKLYRVQVVLQVYALKTTSAVIFMQLSQLIWFSLVKGLCDPVRLKSCDHSFWGQSLRAITGSSAFFSPWLNVLMLPGGIFPLSAFINSPVSGSGGFAFKRKENANGSTTVLKNKKHNALKFDLDWSRLSFVLSAKNRLVLWQWPSDFISAIVQTPASIVCAW